jgi:hypothetical protein
VCVQHPGGQGAFEPGPLSREDRKSASGEDGRPVEVQNAQTISDLPVRERGNRKFPGRALSVDFPVGGFIRTDRDGGVGNIGDEKEPFPECFLPFQEILLDQGDFSVDRPGFLHQGSGLFSNTLFPADLLGQAIAGFSQTLPSFPERGQFLLLLENGIDRDVRFPVQQSFPARLRVRKNASYVEHAAFPESGTESLKGFSGRVLSSNFNALPKDL